MKDHYEHCNCAEIEIIINANNPRPATYKAAQPHRTTNNPLPEMQTTEITLTPTKADKGTPAVVDKTVETASEVVSNTTSTTAAAEDAPMAGRKRRSLRGQGKKKADKAEKADKTEETSASAASDKPMQEEAEAPGRKRGKKGSKSSAAKPLPARREDPCLVFAPKRNVLQAIETVKKIATPGKGILACDEDAKIMASRFDFLQIENTHDQRINIRDVIFFTEGIEKYLSGAILCHETFHDKSKIEPTKTFPEILASKGILVGITLDEGLTNIPPTSEMWTAGLAGLQARCSTFKKLGASFAKWRAVFQVNPSPQALELNAMHLALFASTCQSEGLAPIVEPEIIMEGSHTVQQCLETTQQVLTAVFQALSRFNVVLEGIILKPSMVVSGTTCVSRPSPQQCADATLLAVSRTVPPAVRCIMFLSGGIQDSRATLLLKLINQGVGPKPWYLGFSFGRALQDSCRAAWKGKPDNVDVARKVFLSQCISCSEAALGSL
ncbi:fructose-bisphosphate aldolase 6, cytosolic [Pelomyxa schiedti]|nr:fructose-bisphosphate aldolase 6, cytosolic [Pelomyxa schiedti]